MLNARCPKALRSSPTFWRIRRYGRYVAQDARSSFRTRSVLPPREQPTVINEDGTRTLRQRQHGNTTLPLPPLMDPVAVQAKERHKQPKALRKPGELTDFQKELANNPYGESFVETLRVRLQANV